MNMRYVCRASMLAAIFAIGAVCQSPTDSKPADPKKDPDQIGTRAVDKGLNWYSIPRELALGKQLALEVQRQSKIVDDPVISEYVNRLSQNLARNSDSKFPIQTRVIDDESLNAMSLPGGYLFVNTGLILASDSEAELAGGIAHEIAHIAARHGTRQATRDQMAQLSTIPLIFMGGWPGMASQMGARAIAPLGSRKLDRDFENEADLLGLQYLYKTGYDPAAMVDLLEQIEALQTRRPNRIALLVSTHPVTSDRIIAVQKDIETLLQPRPQYVVSTSEFANVKARLLAAEAPDRKLIPELKRPTLRRPTDHLADSLNIDGSAKHPIHSKQLYTTNVSGLY